MSYHGSCRKEVGVIAALFQVHHHVEQGHLVSSSTSVQGIEVTRQDELVVFPCYNKEKKVEKHQEKREFRD